MNPRRPTKYQRVQFLDEAFEDMKRLAASSPIMLREVLRRLKQLDSGTLRPRSLRDFGKTGDLSDCGKIVVAIENEPEHRIVVRDVGGNFQVCEVVAVADRSQDLPYLLVGLRLGRIHDPIRRSDAQRRIFRIRKLRDP